MNSRVWTGLAIASLAACGVLVGCGDDPSTPAVAPPEKSPERVELGSMSNVHVYENFYLADQPSPEDLELLRERGVTAVINLREEDEMTDFDERELVEGLGMEYHHLPVRDAEALTTEVFDRGLELLREREGEATLVHCGTGGRVAALWLARRLVDDRVSWTPATEEARAMGLPSDEYEGKVGGYAIPASYPSY